MPCIIGAVFLLPALKIFIYRFKNWAKNENFLNEPINQRREIIDSIRGRAAVINSCARGEVIESLHNHRGAADKVVCSGAEVIGSCARGGIIESFT